MLFSMSGCNDLEQLPGVCTAKMQHKVKYQSYLIITNTCQTYGCTILSIFK